MDSDVVSNIGAHTDDWTLPSGLGFLVSRDDRFPLVRVALSVGAGTADGLPAHVDLAHLVEHLWFRTTLDGVDATTALRRAGCQFNGNTQIDHTNFVLECPADARDLALAFMLQISDAQLRGVTAEVVEVEKHVVAHETGDRRDDLANPIYDAAMRALFPDPHPYARLDASEDRLEDLTLAEVRAFVAEHYGPSHSAISVSGAIGPAEVAASVVAHATPTLVLKSADALSTAAWPSSEVSWMQAATPDSTWFVDPADPGKPLKNVSPQFRGYEETVKPTPPVARTEISLPSTRTVVAVAWVVPAIDPRNYWRLIHMARFAAVDAKVMLAPIPSASTPDCYTEPAALASLIVCVSTARESADADKIAKALSGAFARPFSLDRELVLEREDNGTRWAEIERVEREENNIDTTLAMAEHRLATGDPGYWGKRYSEAAQDASVHPYIDLATAWMTPERAAVIIGVPRPELADSGAAAPALSNSAVATTNWAPPDMGRAAAERAQEHTLPNGLRVLLVPAPGRAIASWTLVVPWRDLSEVEADALDDAVETPAKYEGNTIWYPSWVDAEDGYTAARITQIGRWDPRHVARSLWATVDGAQTPARAKISAWTIDDVVRSSLDPRTWEAERVREQLTGIEGAAWLQRVHDAARGSSKSAWMALASEFRPERSTLVVVGELPTETTARIDDELDDWHARGAATPAPTLKPPPWSSGVVVFDHLGGSERASVRVTIPLDTPDLNAPSTRAALALLEQVAEDRAWTTLRASTGLTYTPECSVQVRWGRAFLQIAATTDVLDVAGLLAQARTVLSDLRVHPPTDAELADARRRALANDIVASASIDRLATRLSKLASLGWSRDDIVGWATTVSQTKADGVVALLTHANDSLVTIIGPASTTQEVLQKAGVEARTEDWRTAFLARVAEWTPSHQKQAKAEIAPLE